MDGNSSSDDEIELLNQPGSDERGVGGELLDHESSVNPALFLRRGPSEDSSINPASVHALQTACTSLQHKLNDKTKKYNELLQKNKIMQKALFDMNNEHLRQTGGMDELCQVQEPSIVHAAGAGACSVEDEGAIAEQRARQGYISHLEREVLRNTSAIARGNEEIQRLKRMLDERDREKKGLLQRVDHLQNELDHNSRTYDDTVRSSQRSIEQLEKQHQYLYQENQTLKEKINSIENCSSKDAEIKDLKSKLTVAEKEMTKLTIQYRDLDRRSQEREDELCRLQAQCNQYEIEAEINRKYRDSSDEVDGDAEELLRALDMIKSQRSEVTSLLTQVQQQKNVIKELLIANERDSLPTGKPPSGAVSERRENPTGASMHVPFESETSYGNHGISGYTNLAPVQELSSQMKRDHSPITRRQSDRGDYRGTNRQPAMTSPRLKEHFAPTGNTHIPEMLADEEPRGARRPVGSNVFDCSSPRQNLSPRSHAQSPQPVYMNISNASSPVSQRRELSPNTRVQSPNSPRTRNEIPRNMEPIVGQPFEPVQTCPSASNGGARPKQTYAQDDFVQTRFMEHNPVAQNRIPDRMTQSAILVRDDSNHDNNAMSRSLYSPGSPLESAFNKNTSPERNEFLAQEPVWSRSENTQQHAYNDNIRQADNGPDYENIVNIKPHAGVHRMVEEHDDTTFANDTNVNLPAATRPGQINPEIVPVNQPDTTNPSEGNEVSALKICPVCNLEYSRLTMDQFQTHVFECFDNCEEPTTLQPTAATTDEERNCPMCGETFPLTIPQETYEQHVLAHFGEEPNIERFEMLNS